MNKLLLAVTICTFGTAYAQSGTTAKPATPPSGGTAAAGAPPAMEMPKPGPEQDALKPFVHNGSYTGTHMGPDGKESPEKGKQTCKWLPGNMWASCDIEMTMGTGKTAMKWNGHLVMGYDNMAKGYRAVMTDSMGMMGRMKGTLDGKKMVWESMDEMKNAPPGHAVQGARHRRRHRSEGGEDDVRGHDGRQVDADRRGLVQAERRQVALHFRTLRRAPTFRSAARSSRPPLPLAPCRRP